MGGRKSGRLKDVRRVRRLLRTMNDGGGIWSRVADCRLENLFFAGTKSWQRGYGKRANQRFFHMVTNQDLVSCEIQTFPRGFFVRHFQDLKICTTILQLNSKSMIQ